MKTLKTLFAVGVAALIMSSCAHSVYPVQSMYNYYHSKMKTDDELAIKGKILIFFSEKDIKSDYDIISLNTYKPTSFLPFKNIIEKKMTKNFLKEAAIQAYNEGGNAILIRNAGLFYVLDLKDWDVDSASAANLVNPIFDMHLSNLVESGKLFNMKRSERIRTENMFIEQIDVNLDNVTTLEELEVVRAKIQVLSNYNSSWKTPNEKIKRKIDWYNTKCGFKEERIHRDAEKNAIAKQKEEEKKAIAKQKEEEEEALVQAQREWQQKYDQLSKEEKYAIAVDSINFSTRLIDKAQFGKYIRAFDLNDDGVIDERELKIIYAWASSCDENKDGLWSEEENEKLREMMKKYKKNYEK